MKKHEITPALDALKAVKMQKIEDKQFKKNLLADYVTLVREKRKFTEDIEAIRDKMLGDFADEQQAVSDLQTQLQTETDRNKQVELAREINSHKELFGAIKDFNKSVEDLGNEEISIIGFDQEAFTDEMDKQGYDLAIIEAVFPMFNN